MKNVKNYTDSIAQAVIASNDYSAASVERAIKELRWHKGLTIVNNEEEAQSLYIDMYGLDEINECGGVHTNRIESFRLDITDDEDNMHYYNVYIYEHYADSGCTDYMYSVLVSEIN